jgi:hypothetical protein
VSLSPEEKACISKYDAAAHKKARRVSLSQQKSSLLHKDADAHRKQQEALSLPTRKFKL